MNLILAFIAFNIIVIIHELGHFLVGKKAGIKVLEFSLFIGPKIFSFTRGDTMYSIRLIPALAYVRFEGEEENSVSSSSFNNKPVLSRFLTVAAGPFASILLGVIFLAASYFIGGYDTTVIQKIYEGSPSYNAGLRSGDRIIKYDQKAVYQPYDILLFMFATKGAPAEVEVLRGEEDLKIVYTPMIVPENRYMLGYSPEEAYGEKSNVVKAVSPGFPASNAGILSGDTIIRMNDQRVSSRIEISKFMNENKGNPITITVLRNSKEVQIENVAPTMDKNTEFPEIEFAFASVKGNAFQVIQKAFINTYSSVRTGFYSISWLFSGKVPVNAMAGPVGIVSTINTVVEQSPSFKDVLMNLLSISALISIGLGVTNLLPIPPTDGFKIILYGIEAIRRKPLPVEKEAAISMVGFVLMFTLFILFTFNDIVRIVTGG